MKHFCFAACVVLLLVLLMVLPITTAVGSAQQQPKKAVIAGVISQAGTATPIPAARVTLTRQARGGSTELPTPGQVGPRGGRGAAAPLPEIPSVATDDAGRFIFQEVDDGNYAISVLANGYVGQNYGQRFAGGPGTPISVAVGQEITDVSVALTPAGNISGRILDPADEPLINVPVQLYRYAYDASGQRKYQSAGSVVTNDRGEYRLYWLTPGRYYLMAGQPTSSLNPMLAIAASMVGGGATNNANVPPAPMNYTYYPGVTDVTEARSIELLPGAELSGIDLRLTPKPRTFRVRGRLIDPRTGQPPQRASVTISPQTLNAGLTSASLAMIGEDIPGSNYNAKTGVLEFKDLLPGVYTVTATAQEIQTDPAARGQAGPENVQRLKLTGVSTVVVSNENIDGLIVPVVPATAIPGQIRIEGSLPASVTMEMMRVQLAPTAGGIDLGQQQTAVKADGSFRLENVPPGDYRIRIMARGPAPTYIKDARLEGSDVLNVPLRISGPVSGSLEIVVAFGGGQVSGIVTDARLQPAALTQVTLIPTRYRDRIDLYRTVTTDENGRFTMPFIPPGSYKAFSWESIDPYGWFDPEVLAVSEDVGRAVQVTEGSSEPIEVRLIPAGGAR